MDSKIDMYIEHVYIGYNDAPNGKNLPVFHLFQVHFKRPYLLTLEHNVRLKTYNTLPTLQDVYKDPSIKRNAFSININLKNLKINYYSKLIANLYMQILNGNKKVITSLKNTHKLNKCKYVIYFGRRVKNRACNILSIFPFKKNYVFNAKRSGLLIRSSYNDTSYFKFISKKNVFQLPFDKSDNVAKFYELSNKKGNNESVFKLLVYNPSKFDKISNTTKFKFHLAKKHIRDFQNGSIMLSNNNRISVHFRDIQYMFNLIKSKKHTNKDMYLIDNIANFTDNKNSVIKRVTIGQIQQTLKLLKNYSIHQTECQFNIKNVPSLKSIRVNNEIKYGKLIINRYSLPIFCSLLKNSIVEKLLNEEIYIPYYK